MRFLFQFFVPLVTAALAVAGAIYGVEWAGNLAVFAVWVTLFFAGWYLLTSVERCLAIDSKRAVPRWYPRLLNTIQLVAFVAAGWFVTGTVFALAWFFSYAKAEAVREARRAKQAAPQAA